MQPRITRLTVWSLALLGIFSAYTSLAEPNSPERVKAFAALPDWSGLWEQTDVGADGQFAAGAASSAALKEMMALPPYNEAWRARYDRMAAEADAAADRVVCTFGFPQLMFGSPLMFQAIVTPEETTLMFSQRETRHIYTDGRAIPPQDELFLSPWGYSVGHWEGDTLVVDTAASSSPLAIFDGVHIHPLPLSDQIHYHERLRMVQHNALEDRITLTDPVAFTRPWELTRRYTRVPNMNALVDEDCLGNDRDPVVDGKFTLAPPSAAGNGH